jgi:hypothetical protein
MIKRILYILLAVVLVAQFIRPGRTAEPVDPAGDLIAVTHPSAEVEGILRTACYDCHSGQPRYPWYVNITPVNWWLQSHINEGREHFNASAWGTVDAEKRAHWAEEVIEMVQEGEMPLDSYTWTHADARLTDAQRQQLVAFFQPYNTGEGAEGEGRKAED